MYVYANRVVYYNASHSLDGLVIECPSIDVNLQMIKVNLEHH